MRANYPFNCWYVAATSDEVSESPLGRRILGIPVVLYRSSPGEVVALEDRCAHRPYPLSTGWVSGDRLVCQYHGFAYEPDGACVAVPSQDSVPRGTCIRTFSVREQAPYVWIWLGDPGSAQLRQPPRTPWFTDSAWASSGEVLHVAANFMLLHEHYLDLTHVFTMHPEAVPPGIEALPPLGDVEVSEMSVSYSRTLPRAGLADWEAEATGLPRHATYNRRELGDFVSPALHYQRYIIEADDGGSYEQVRIQGFTPESPTTTHVFLQIARNYAIDRTEVTDHLRAMFRRMAERDVAVLEDVQSRIDADGGTRRDVNVTADRAALHARRVAAAMVAEETGQLMRTAKGGSW